MPSTLPSPPIPPPPKPPSLSLPSLLSHPRQYPTVPPGCAPPRRLAKEAVPGHTSQWLRFCRDATAALRKWKTGHNFPKMLFFITYFPFISLPRTIDSWWHLWQLNVFTVRFMGYLLLSFYSSNSVKMLISPIRGGRVCVCVCTKWYHTQLNVCMCQGASWLHCSPGLYEPSRVVEPLKLPLQRHTNEITILHYSKMMRVSWCVML